MPDERAHEEPDDEPGELTDPGREPPPDEGADPNEFPPLPPNRDEGTRA
jgi:hypothetical protein